MRRAIKLSVCLVLAAGGLRAQSVSWNPSSGKLGLGQTAQLELVFENCTPNGDVALPTVDGLEVGTASTSQQFRMMNFQVTRTATLTYPVRPLKPGPLEIPAFSVETNAGPVAVSEARFEVVNEPQAAGTGGREELDGAVRTELLLGRDEVWKGEIVEVIYNFRAWQRYRTQLGGAPEWTPPPLQLEGWQKADQSTENIDGREFATLRLTTRGLAKQAGEHLLPPAEAVVSIGGMGMDSGLPNFDALFRMARQYRVQSNAPRLKVKPLPEGAPASFTGAVGQFQILGQVLPQGPVAVGQPVTWTVEAHGEGNWPEGFSLPQRRVSKDFRVISPKSKTEPDAETPFRGRMTEDVVLIPLQAGTYTLEPLEFTYFDPGKGEYVTLRTEPATVTVTADAGGPGTAAPAGVVPPPAAAPWIPPAGAPPVGVETAVELPRGPLAGVATAWCPWGRGWMYGWLSLLVAIPAGWLLLAWWHAGTTVPWAGRRMAWKRLRVLCRKWTGTPPRADLLEWMRQGAWAWGVGGAVPAAAAVREAAGRLGGDAEAQAWGELWEQAERHLFGEEVALPVDWAGRARAAAERLRLPGIPPWHAVFPRNLFPLLVAAVLLAARAGAAGDPLVDAYGSGKFDEMAEAGRARVAENPLDWRARYNLALGLLQGGRAVEAAGWAHSTLALAPGEPDVRWNARLAAERSGVAWEPGWLLEPAGLDAAVARLAPAAWQRAAAAAAMVVVAAALAGLVSAYRRARPVWPGLCFTAALMALAAGGLAVAASERYGVLADPGAAWVVRETAVRSIPTEVDPQMKGKATPGSLVVVEGEFLGWRKVRLANNDEGWVRAPALVPVYRRP